MSGILIGQETIIAVGAVVTKNFLSYVFCKWSDGNSY